MRRIVVSEFVSLDGVMEDPGGSEGSKHGGWTFKFDRGPEGDRFKLDELMASDALLLGRVTYEAFAAAWPSISDEAGFAEKMNGMPKYVVSRTLKSGGWGPTTILSGDAAAEITRVKEGEGGELLIAGSARLVQALIEAELVDECRLMVFPIVLGSGKRLFGETSSARTFRLASTETVGPDGVVILNYERAATPEPRKSQ